MGSFLRKNQRALKLSTLSLLDTLVQNYSHYLYPDLLRSVISEVPPLLSEADLHIAQLTLVLLTSIARVYSGALVDVADAILPEILTLVKSPLLQGAALESMLEFFQALVSCRLPGLGYHDVLKLLVRPVALGSPTNTLHKQAFHSLAKCVAAITVIYEHEALPVVEQFMKDVVGANNDAQHVFALLVIGEIGRHIDLSSVVQLKTVVLNSFSHVSEEVKSAASYTLGNISIGNLPQYLPFVLQVSFLYFLHSKFNLTVTGSDWRHIQNRFCLNLYRSRKKKVDRSNFLDFILNF